jgi:holo-[acyl-carrier protein] synthase
MILGIGVDLVDLARFEQHILDNPRLGDRLFHEFEQELHMRQLAGSFAAKEALVKALGGPDGLSWTELWVERDNAGKPHLRSEGASAATIASAGVDRLHLSISHDGGMLTAYVIAEADSTPNGGQNA